MDGQQGFAGAGHSFDQQLGCQGCLTLGLLLLIVPSIRCMGPGFIESAAIYGREAT